MLCNLQLRYTQIRRRALCDNFVRCYPILLILLAESIPEEICNKSLI